MSVQLRNDELISLLRSEFGGGGTVYVNSGGAASAPRAASAAPYDDALALYKTGARALEGSLPILDNVVLGGALRWWRDTARVETELFAGFDTGARAGLFKRKLGDGMLANFMESTATDNVPLFSTGAKEGVAGSEWLKLGREGRPGIRWEGDAQTGRMVVDLACLNGLLTSEHIDSSRVALAVYDEFPSEALAEGTPIFLRRGSDSGAIYVWTQWGPEPVGGYHVAGLHDHESDGEGGVLATYMRTADFLDGAADDLIPIADAARPLGFRWDMRTVARQFDFQPQFANAIFVQAGIGILEHFDAAAQGFNAYLWSTDIDEEQTIQIVLRWRLPLTFTGFTGPLFITSKVVGRYAESSLTVNEFLTPDGVNAITPTSVRSEDWTENAYPLNEASFTPGGICTLRLTMTALLGQYVYLGPIRLPYNEAL